MDKKWIEVKREERIERERWKEKRWKGRWGKMYMYNICIYIQVDL